VQGRAYRTMNIFRLLGDLAHILSFVALLHKIIKGKTSAGISLKTQQCFAIVFCSRYIDLLWNFASLYNMFLKVCFIGASVTIVYTMMTGAPQKATYNAENDTFPLQYLILPCAVMGLIINQNHFDLFEIVWAFSIYLEAVAILPQLFLLQKLGEVENLTSHYVALLGAYRGLYLLNWIYRYMTEVGYVQLIVWFAGLVQTALYCDFFYHYYESKSKGGINKAVQLPV
jgi:ER lumen protein retaining receptor